VAFRDPVERPVPAARGHLRAVKLIHTAAWALFAGCIALIPVFAWARRFDVAFALIGLVLLEVLILGANGWRCPLTAIAARYTDDRRDNFDIYLPEWLARHNKTIFGTWFVLGLLLTLGCWLQAPG
jgi:polyferredoxin